MKRVEEVFRRPSRWKNKWFGTDHLYVAFSNSGTEAVANNPARHTHVTVSPEAWDSMGKPDSLTVVLVKED